MPPGFSMRASPGYLTNHLARLFAAGLQRRIKPLGLSTGTFPIMLQLWERDGMTQREIVERLGIEQATVGNTLARMERDGLIDRRSDEEDGRLRRTWLTERGQGLREPAVRAAMDENMAALASLPPEDRAELVRLLSKAIETYGR